MRCHHSVSGAPHPPCGAFFFLLLAVACGLVGCETQSTTTENYGFGMEFEEQPNADEARVID